MTQEGQLPPPPVMWAQRSHVLYVTICLEDCKDAVVNVTADTIYFKGVGGTEKKMHEVTIHLYNEIDPDKTLKDLKGRTVELVLAKKEEGPYWPRLTKEKTKAHWLKSDFNKWRDEDDSEEEGYAEERPGELDAEIMRQVSRWNRVGPNKSQFDNLEDMVDEGGEGDSDDDDIPDLIG